MQKVITTNIGTCAFRNEGDGCLTAKYMNESAESPFVEGCKLNIIHPAGGYCGNYDTVWLEDEKKMFKAQLEIIPHPINPKLFQLTWSHQNGNVIFKGHGMLFENLLVAAYWEP